MQWAVKLVNITDPLIRRRKKRNQIPVHTFSQRTPHKARRKFVAVQPACYPFSDPSIVQTVHWLESHRNVADICWFYMK